MNKFKFGGIDKPGIYRRERHAHVTHRRIFPARAAADARRQEGQGKAALNYAEKGDSRLQRLL